MRGKLAGLFVCIVIGVAALCMFNSGGQAQESTAAPDTANAEQSSVERGKYIVHHVAMCIYCHTPRNSEGVLDQQRLLHGAPMPVASPFAGQQWAFQAPKIAGLPGGWSEADTVKFLQTGKSPTGHEPRPPMPPFRFNEQDALAVAAYLDSL
jgi:mono/diheme cytochrome c family protein